MRKITKKGTKNKSHGRRKGSYRVQNWSSYNQGLINRGNICILIDKKDINQNWYAPSKKANGRPVTYSNHAIETTLTIGHIFKQRLRQTEGLVTSLFQIMGLAVEIPTYSTLSRRASTLSIQLNPSEDSVVIVDSTGLKVCGEGEWKVRKHGYNKMRTWRKLHVSIDKQGHIRSATLTSNACHDSQAVPQLVEQDLSPFDRFVADGAYDTKSVYQLLHEQLHIPDICIPPICTARIWQRKNKHDPPHPRDLNLRTIRQSTRKQWKQTSGYHVRSLVENTMFRYKTIFSATLNARKETTQNTEILIRCSILNRFKSIAWPNSVLVT